MKLLFWLLLAFAAGWYFRSKNNTTGARRTGAAPAARPRVEAMAACPQCQVHAPVSEMVRGTNGQLFCSAEHARRHGRAQAADPHA